MASFLEHDESAALSFIAGIVFVLVALLQFFTSGDWVVIMLNGVLGFLLFVDGSRNLVAAERNSHSQ